MRYIGHYRLIFAAQVLQAAGHEVEIVSPAEPSRLGLQPSLSGGQPKAIYPDDADVIVLQRPSHENMAILVQALQRQGVAVVVDIDDDLDHIHPANPAWLHLHPKTSSGHSWKNVRLCCKHATLVTVSSERLLGIYAAHGRGRVLPNLLPASYLDVERTDAAWIGWAGSTHSHPDDFDGMHVISKLIYDGHLFKVVGTSAGLGRKLGLPVDPSETGTIAMEDWPQAVSKIGVGIAPLADTVFNQSKSWLKPLEYSAAGVPWIASPRAEYRRLHELGCGLLADKPREWERHLRALVGSTEMRIDYSGRGREVAQRLTYEEHAWRWWETWEVARGLQSRTPMSPSMKAPDGGTKRTITL